MVYHFGIAYQTDREIVLKESRNLGAIIGAAVAAIIVGSALTICGGQAEWGAVGLLGVAETWCLGLLVMGAAESEITVSLDRMSVVIVRSISPVRVRRHYELDQVQRFYEVTATLRGGGGKGLRAELHSGKKITLSIWARSDSLKTEILALTALSDSRVRKSGVSRHRSA
jgi:hypothetical protein